MQKNSGVFNAISNSNLRMKYRKWLNVTKISSELFILNRLILLIRVCWRDYTRRVRSKRILTVPIYRTIIELIKLIIIKVINIITTIK